MNYSMIKFATLSRWICVIFALITLDGCVSPPAVRHVEETPNPQSLRTLRTYKNNMFGLKIQETAQDAYNDSGYKVPDEKTVIHYVAPEKLVVPTFYAYGFLQNPERYSIYNIRDIKEITNNKNKTAIVYMQDGRIFRHVPIYSIKFYGCREKTLECRPAVWWDQSPPWFDDYNQYLHTNTLYMDGFYNFEFAKPKIFADIAAGDFHGQNFDTWTVYAHDLIPDSTLSISVLSYKRYTHIANELGSEEDPIIRAWNAKQKAKLQSQELAIARTKRRVWHEAIVMRRHIRIGTETNCGAVISIRLPMVGVQTTNGISYIRLRDLFAPGVGCRLRGKLYVGPIFPW